jgi:hypothetical protein
MAISQKLTTKTLILTCNNGVPAFWSVCQLTKGVAASEKRFEILFPIISKNSRALKSWE